MAEKLIFHVDVNSAFLSFEAVYRLQHGAKVDLRDIPSAVAGSQATRHGIILAKSAPAKIWDKNRRTHLAGHAKMSASFYSSAQLCSLHVLS